MTGVLSFAFPFRAVPHLNRREHWRASWLAKRKEREAIRVAWIAAGRPRPALPCSVTFVRVGSRLLDEGDNLASAFKAMRDELADVLGVKDGPAGPVTWVYRQERGHYAVRVEMGW